MSKTLTTIVLDAEDVVRALETVNYEYATKLRSILTSKRHTLVFIKNPSSGTEFIYEESIKPSETTS